MDKFRDDTANALIVHSAGLARWINSTLPASLLDSISGGSNRIGGDPAETLSMQLGCLAEAVRFDEPTLFLDCLTWVDSRRREGQPPIEEYLYTLQTAAENCLPNALVGFIAPVLQKAFATFIQSNAHVASPFDRAAPFADAAATWLEMLLAQKTSDARRFIFRCVDSGLRPLDLFDFVFAPTLRQVGWLWQTREIDEAQEHFCATFTQNILGILSAEFAGPGIPCSAVGFCVGGELHDVAIRMICESLFMHGWDSTAYGANLPTNNVGSLIQQKQPNLVAISVTLTENLRTAQESIAAIRAANLRRKPRILVGGRPFQLCPTLVEKIGADGTASSCSQLVAHLNSDSLQ